jgi:ribosomal protein S18 acetylase RimI-like enzyme
MTAVRPARAEDGPALREIERVTMTAAASPAPAPPEVPDFFRRGLEPVDVLVAEDGGAVVGYVTLEQSWPVAAHGHVLDVAGLGVHPAHQRRGIGRALVEAAAAEAARRGARKLSLRVLAPNLAARGLYASCGFEVEGVLAGEFLLEGTFVDDVLMARVLDA